MHMKLHPGGRESRQGRTGVVVLGWLGSTPRRLRRHTELFSRALGLDTLVAIPSVTSAIVPFVACRTARSIERELTQGVFAEKERLVFLNMSGNGDNTFSHLLILQGSGKASVADKKKKANAKAKSDCGCDCGCAEQRASVAAAAPRRYGKIAQRTKGVVYDSAPVPQTSWLWSQALTAAVMSNLPFRKSGTPAQYNVPVLTRAVRLCSDAHLSLVWNRRWKGRLYNASFVHLPQETQMMFVYSQNDYLVPACYVEDYADKHRAAGRRVTKHDFGDSAHVEHLRKYPRRYAAAAKAFLASITMI